jgi:hypothetical protein
VRLILAEDSTLLREGLVRLLAEEVHEVLRAALVVRRLLVRTSHTDPLARLTVREREAGYSRRVLAVLHYLGS